MKYVIVFSVIIAFGIYMSYIKPKKDIFNHFKNNIDFNNDILIIESNSEFDKENHQLFVKHLKLFLLYYTEAKECKSQNVNMKLKHQYDEIFRYLGNMLKNIPQSMRRHEYMSIVINNLREILSNCL